MTSRKPQGRADRPSLAPVRSAGQPASPTPPRSSAAVVAAICAALAIVTLAGFLGVLSNAFVNYDDNVYVTDNRHVLPGLSPASIAWAFTTFDSANWHPLTWLSHMLDVQIFGLDPGRHHLTSLLLHALNVILVFLLLRRMTGAIWRSAIVAALFAIHPLHVESVAWIAERKDVLSTFFWLATLWAWLWYLLSRTPLRYVLVLVLFACGLMAKPMLVTLPFTLLLLDYWPLHRLTPRGGSDEGPRAGEASAQVAPTPRLTRLAMEKAPMFALSAASCVVTFVAQQRGGAVQTLEGLPFGERVANALVAYVSYLAKTIWPSKLAVLYPLAHLELLSWQVAGAALLLGGATALAVRFARQAPYLIMGWLWFVGTLVPVIGLVQVGGQAMADRYTYVPLLGIFAATVWGTGDLLQKLSRPSGALSPGPPLPAVLAGAVLLPLFIATRSQVAYWADNKTLFGHALAVTSENCVAHNDLGLALMEEGRTDEAVAHYNEALRIKPDYSDAHVNLGLALEKQGRHDEALSHLIRALELAPGSARVHACAGNILVGAGRTDAAIEQFMEAVRLDPVFPEARTNLGAVLFQKGRTAEAVEQYEIALRLKPGHFEAVNNLGLALASLNRIPEAIERFQQAVRLRPDSAEAHNNLGVALSRMNLNSEAVEQFREALRISPGLERARANLKSAEEALGWKR